MKSHGKAVCQTEIDHIARLDQMKGAARDATFDEFEEAVSQSGSRRDDSSAGKSKKYRQFVENVNRLQNEETDVLNASTEEFLPEDNHAVRIDPLTKGELVNPVRNRHCKHIYGRDSIIATLRQNGRLR